MAGLRANAVRNALHNPVGTARLLASKRGWRRIRYALRPPPHGSLQPSPDVSRRAYRNYDDYVKHQRSKLGLLDLTDYDRDFRLTLAVRLRPMGLAGKSVLCLAARIGTEVKAFHDVGAFAVGLDLNPGHHNPWVLPGDFHDLVFAGNSVDVVYSNSLDHALDVGRVADEARRVLKRDGALLVDAQAGAAENEFDDWAATRWPSIDGLIETIVAHGFALSDRTQISDPWAGESLRFTPVAEPGGSAQGPSHRVTVPE
jgi:SAM-dependent methyltransferase